MLKGKKVLAVVPARGGSKGIKLKNLRTINGKSLIAFVGNTLKELNFIDKAVVSTDHEEIAKESENNGISAPFRRPESLSGDRIGDLEVLSHALLESEKQDETTYDIVLMLQPTSPLRRPEEVQSCTEKLIDEELDAVWTVSETDSKGHPFKQLHLDDDNRVSYYDEENGKKIIARQQLKPVYHRNGICYAISRNCLLEKKSIHGDKWGAVLINHPSISIDTEFDLKLAEFYLNLD